MGSRVRRVLVATAVACCMVVTAAACTSSRSANEGKDLTLDGGGDGSGGVTDNPCSVITQAQWEALFGAGARKGRPTGDAERCRVTARTPSTADTVSFTDLTATRDASFEDARRAYPGCGAKASTPVEVDGVGDRAVVDTSCAATSGRAWLIAQDRGFALVFAYDAGGPAPVDTAAIATTLTDIAERVVAYR